MRNLLVAKLQVLVAVDRVVTCLPSSLPLPSLPSPEDPLPPSLTLSLSRFLSLSLSLSLDRLRSFLESLLARL